MFLLQMLQADADRRAQTHEELVDKIFSAQRSMWDDPKEIPDEESPIRSTIAILPRALFVPDEFIEKSTYDMPLELYPVLPTNLSASHIYPRLLQCLDLRPGLRVLDIGSGTGYLCCAIANIIYPGGKVVGWELHDKVTQFAKVNVVLVFDYPYFTNKK